VLSFSLRLLFSLTSKVHIYSDTNTLLLDAILV